MDLKALLTGKPTVAQCDAELAKIEQRLGEIDNRLAEIGDHGAARQAARLDGDVDQLVAMTHEAERLEAEDEALRAQRESLKERRVQAEAEQAPAKAKKALKEIHAQLDKMERAQAELEAARNALHAAQTDFVHARSIAIKAGLDVVAMTEAEVRRMNAVCGTKATRTGAQRYGWSVPGEELLPVIGGTPPGESPRHGYIRQRRGEPVEG